MTTMTLETTESTRRLEELVDRLLAALLGDRANTDLNGDSAPDSGLVRSVHEARRLRQSGDLDGALAVLHEVDTSTASDSQLRWLFAEWRDIARRRFAGCDVMLYSPSTGQSAALVPAGDDNTTLEVAAMLGMRWPVGKLVSRRSLRGLKALHSNNRGGAAWS